MSYDDRDRSTDDLVQMYLENGPTLEGSSGLKSLRDFLTASGYKQETYSGMSVGNQIEDFLADNPDAIETLIKWVGEEIIGDDPDLRKNLIELLPPSCPECGFESEAPGKQCDDCAVPTTAWPKPEATNAEA